LIISETRSTKSETLNKFEIQSTNDQNSKQTHLGPADFGESAAADRAAAGGGFWTFEFCSFDFDIVSDFDIRISHLIPFMPNSYDSILKCKIALQD